MAKNWDGSFSQDDELDSTGWNNHVTDQKNRGYNNLSSVSSDTTAETQQILLVDASGGNVTITLPSAESSANVIVKRTDSSANSVTIATPNSETIDGSSSVTLSSQYATREITSDGSNYFVISSV